jgi:uncharacterized protein (TIGR02231 family)
MRFRAGVVVGCGVALVLAAPARGAEPVVLPSRITDVTVYADRALVTRTAELEISPGSTRFAVTQLPGWIDAESVRVAIVPATAGQVADVGVETTYLADASEEAVRKAELAVRDAAADLAAVTDEERTLTEEISRLDAVRALSIDKLPRELAMGDVKVKQLADTMGYVTSAVRNDRAQLRALARKQPDLEPVLAQRQRELSELQVRAQLQQTTVRIDLRGSGHAQLRVTYLIPGAAWEPLGEIRVSRGSSVVAVAQYASVSQTTGEDWAQARLSFSTQNPNAVLDVPRIHGLMLDKGGAGLGNVVSGISGSFSRAQALYAEGNESFAKKKAAWRESLQRQAEVQSRAVEHFGKISRRGTTAHFAALGGDTTVRADGKTIRVPIASGDYTAAARVVAAPEVSLNAVRVANLVNGGSTPILPGRALLFQDGAFVGRSELDFVAPGEKFSVFLGVDDQIKLERKLDKKLSALHWRGKRTEMGLSYLVTAENLGSTPVEVDLSERIPVAQTEEIEVGDVEVPHKVKPDAEGLVKWSEEIPAHARLSWRIAYKLDYPSDFVARSRAVAEAAPAPAAPDVAPERKDARIYDFIDQSENALK